MLLSSYAQKITQKGVVQQQNIEEMHEETEPDLTRRSRTAMEMNSASLNAYGLSVA